MERTGEGAVPAAGDLQLSGVPEDAEFHGGHVGHGGHLWVSVRTATHRGHDIRIETTYRVTVDDQDLEGLEVLDNGSMHYHGLPQYAVPSAIDMVKLVIDHLGVEPPAYDELEEVPP